MLVSQSGWQRGVEVSRHSWRNDIAVRDRSLRPGNDGNRKRRSVRSHRYPLRPPARFSPFDTHATRCAVTRRHCDTGTAPDPAKARRWLQHAANKGSEKASVAPLCGRYRRCDRRSHDHVGGQAVECASGLGYELREGRYTRGRRAGPRPRADRQLVQAGAVTGSVRPIRLRPATCRNRTLRGRAVNRTAARNSHGRIEGAVSSPRAESSSVPIGAAMTKRILVVRFRLGTLARLYRNHICRQDKQPRFCRFVIHMKVYVSAKHSRRYPSPRPATARTCSNGPLNPSAVFEANPQPICIPAWDLAAEPLAHGRCRTRTTRSSAPRYPFCVVGRSKMFGNNSYQFWLRLATSGTTAEYSAMFA